MSASPRPWFVCGYPPPNKYWITDQTIGSEPDGTRVADLCQFRTDAENAANAALIVRAVNAHDDLCAALNNLAAEVAEMAGRGRLPSGVERAIDAAGSALAKAGKQ